MTEQKLKGEQERWGWIVVGATFVTLGMVYGVVGGLAPAQFTRWHLDHHDNLGSWEDDPKRHWLSPKRNARCAKRRCRKATRSLPHSWRESWRQSKRGP